ncbi:MAG: tetratricopeptide repeat protein [Bacteroidota bacterium]
MEKIISPKTALLVTVCFNCLTSFSQINFNKGDKYFDQNLFGEAIKCYQNDLKAKNRKVADHAIQKLADCYRITGEFEKAEATYKKILKKKKKEPIHYLNYGLSLKSSAKYAEAIVQFQEYSILKPQDPMGRIFLLSCDSAQKWLEETIGKEVKNLDAINTEQSEFSPVIYEKEKLIFSSSRIGSKKALISFDGGSETHRTDLYSITLQKVETKENIRPDIYNLEAINTPMHEGSASFTKDGKEVYFTKTVKGKRNTDNNILNTLQIFYSRQDSTGKWIKPISAFSFNSLKYSVGHPCLTTDGGTIYFMSDKPGGFGKTDIYYSIKQEDGTWGAPVNVGKNINTFGHELFPYISEENTLYFSSNSHPGMGQLDIFKATKDSSWSNVQNLKPPINSIGNDFGIVFDGRYQRGFFSSDRFNGKGAEDIYSFSEDVPLELVSQKDSLIFEDESIFDDIKYKLVNELDKSETTLQSSGGRFFVKLDAGGTYSLIASKNGMPYNRISLTCIKNDESYFTTINSTEKAIYLNEKLVEPAE